MLRRIASLSVRTPSLSPAPLLTSFTNRLVESLSITPPPPLAFDAPAASSSSSPSTSSLSDDLFDSLWFAVPKSKISRSKKRIKNQRYKLKNKTHIHKDPVTGEWTERHRLPINWKFYLREDGYGPKNRGDKIDVEEEE
ncbi:hypothetical protein TrCOL_g7513 [Triparma columacea]|uniref:50S ribosomal protein L32 n=1 Tax=Triparma columacea TaxID=722753 RepID=A0A9W7G3U4_9STRA|nr:hypothetical protein TrCOL_g7513 [Triparma columacea]